MQMLFSFFLCFILQELCKLKFFFFLMKKKNQFKDLWHSYNSLNFFFHHLL